jgi:hypothetical protein
MPASELLTDTTGEALRFLEERLTSARQEIFASNADSANRQQDAAVQEVRRRVALVFDEAEKILVLARIAQQRKT